ncbi:CmpA/NrtA family ABC transporter substrate-binding protein [Roseibium litorale]|uniref:ABC transporter substrate-binding protein n=1 Tax=Roseibium litorale TaxID=2803841 RepID=A0ABR9CTN6_9HYPH|nr:CmpA/NrtA family ABC transporter substrate-binding protein [Roseibium litorale]MBD8894240.1 ABC transporter substrate-binding protein [Roseibium litorale]
MSAISRQTIVAGFLPLLDCALLAVAARRGFAEAEGIELKLVRETSWANIRDRISVGHFDVAHMLAPMPIASSLSLTTLAVPMRAVMALGTGGNAISVSGDLWQEMKAQGAAEDGDPLSTGQALAGVIRNRSAAGAPLLHFGVVHPFSGHAYELRYWLAASGIHPERDVEISVLPPTVMADALAAGQLDGYCVGEPWNTKAADTAGARIVTTKEAIWPGSPEKVLGVTAKWAEANGDLLMQLIKVLMAAADWCADPVNLEELASLLAGPEFLDCPVDWCRPALQGRLRFDAQTEVVIPGFLSFGGIERHCPREEHGLWFYAQMVRWGQAQFSESDLGLVRQTFSPALFLKALGSDGALAKGGRDAGSALFDGQIFSEQTLADHIAGYVRQS